MKPEEVIHRVKRSAQEKTEEQVRDLEKVRESPTYNELELLYKHGIEKVEPTDLSGIVKGRKAIYDHLKSIITDSEKSITIVTTESGFIRKVDALRASLKKAKDKGVSIKIAAPVDSFKVPKELQQYADVRTLPKGNARFVVVDGSNVMFMLSDDKDVHESYDLGVWVNTPFFGAALEQLFEVSWDKLKPVKQ